MSLLLLCWGRSSLLARFWVFFAGGGEMGIPPLVDFFAFSICLLLHNFDICFGSVAYSMLGYLLDCL